MVLQISLELLNFQKLLLTGEIRLMTSSMFISTVGLRTLGIPVAPLKATTDKQDNRLSPLLPDIDAVSPAISQ